MSFGAAVNRDARLQLILFMLTLQQPRDSDAEANTGALYLPPNSGIETQCSQRLEQGMQTPQTNSCR